MNSVELKYKPDFARVREMWNHYWAGDVLKRPLVVASVPREGVDSSVGKPYYRYYTALQKDYKTRFECIDNILESTEYMAESVPFFGPDLGPDQFASFLGAEFKFSESSMETNWVDPIVENWEDVLPLRFDGNNRNFRHLVEVASKMAEHGKGRYLVGVCDYHSNGDTLSALRSPEKLCMDFYDCPELVARAMGDVREMYKPVYDAVYKAGGMSEATGSIGWIPFWCEGKFASVQCDFMCMVSPEICREYILPAIEEEAAYLDHCVFHLDGPGALSHLDDILAMKDIDVLQWVPGAGQAPVYEWLDVLKKAQKAGKGLQIYGVSLDIIKRISRELSPEGIVYCLDAKTRREVDETTDWLEKNT